MKTFTSLIALLFVASLTTSAVAQSRLRINVHCGAQGILDDKHTVTVTVKHTGQPPDVVTVTVDVPKYADSEWIAGALADKLNAFAGQCGQFRAEEVFVPDPPPTDPDVFRLKNENLVFPPCWVLVKVSAVREGQTGAGGQLQIYNNANKPLLLVPPPVLTIEMDVHQSAYPILTSIDLYELDANGVTILNEFHGSVVATGDTVNPLSDLGTWLEDALGATVTYPTATSMKAEIATAWNLNWFEGCVADLEGNPPQHLAEFSFTVY